MTIVKIKKKQAGYQTTEAFRTIKTNLRFCGRDKKVIAVTSCVPNEGKSSVSMRLAQALREDGAKVILIDADLRKSVMFRQVMVEKGSRGLSDYLAGQCSVNDIICDTDLENFKIILCGITPPNPTELLRTEAFRKLLQKLREMYDYVLVDTPPVGLVIDAAVIAESCDGILWVISSGQISRRIALETKEQIEKSGCPLLGAVLNKTESSLSEYEYYGGKLR